MFGAEEEEEDEPCCEEGEEEWADGTTAGWAANAAWRPVSAGSLRASTCSMGAGSGSGEGEEGGETGEEVGV